ncbi:hypothetical protein D049_0307A, partial [Vibrio parahaemolyticus VPTS-2010]
MARKFCGVAGMGP